MNSQLNIIILAAGKGTRMKSELPKTLCEINAKPMLFYILDTVTKIEPQKIIIVVGHKSEMIINKLKEYPYKNIEFVYQNDALGTGDAVKQAEVVFKELNGTSLILFGDKPFISIDTINKLISEYNEKNLDACFISYKAELGYQKNGRIIRNGMGEIMRIQEDPNIKYPSDEYNAGIQLYNTKILFTYIKEITNNNAKNEYYLGDVIKIIKKNNYLIGNVLIDNRSELLNINTKEELYFAESKLKS